MIFAILTMLISLGDLSNILYVDPIVYIILMFCIFVETIFTSSY